MFEENEIDSTLLQYLLNEQTEEERKLTEAWIQEKAEHRNYFEDLRKTHILLKSAMQPDAVQGTYSQLHSHIQRRKTLRRFSRIAAVVTLFIGAGIGMYFIDHATTPSTPLIAETSVQPGTSQAILRLSSGETVRIDASSQELQEMDGTRIDVSGDGSLSYKQDRNVKAGELQNSLEIPRGGEFRLTLADGTEVWLNSETELQYPTTFTGDERVVSLKGEAYFKVAKNPGLPFIVRVGEMQVRVYGTEFNVSSQNEGKIETVLVNGSVSIIAKGRETQLKPDQMAELTPSTGEITVRNVNVLPYIAWKEGNFMFHNESLGTIMEKMARWYDLNVFYVNQDARDIRLSGVLERYKDANELFRHFEKISAARFEVKGNTVFIETKQTNEDK